MPTNSRYVSPITAPPFFPDRPWRVITPVLALAARLPTGCAPRSPRRGAGPSPALGAQVGEALSARRPKSTPRLSMGGRRRHRVHRVSRCTLLFTTVRGGTFSGRPTGFLRSPRHELDRKVQGGWVRPGTRTSTRTGEAGYRGTETSSATTPLRPTSSGHQREMRP